MPASTPHFDIPSLLPSFGPVNILMPLSRENWAWAPRLQHFSLMRHCSPVAMLVIVPDQILQPNRKPADMPLPEPTQVS